MDAGVRIHQSEKSQGRACLGGDEDLREDERVGIVSGVTYAQCSGRGRAEQTARGDEFRATRAKPQAHTTHEMAGVVESTRPRPRVQGTNGLTFVY